jgi:hypothetical protein
MSSGKVAFEIVPPPGLVAGMWLYTVNTASRSYAAIDNTPAYHWLIVDDARSTSNTSGAHVVDLPHTDAGPVMSDIVRVESARGFRARDAIFELRCLTGITWDELAKLMSVTRRSLHLWANGHPINVPNEKRLRDLLSAMQMIDRGSARENWALLMSPRPEGGVFSDLLRDGRLDEAHARAGRGNGRAAPAREVGNALPRIVRLSVEDSFNTRSDRVHIDNSVVVAGRRRRRPPQG